jgi:mannose-1-phosphate guanylyltransferase
MLHAVVMAGGSGTRFWPMSRRNRPKHLLALVGSESLLQQTVRRISPLVPPERTWVITGADHVGATRQQLPELLAPAIIAEPCRRDTAPCIGLAATLVSRADADATLVVLPADHVIEPGEEFRRAIEIAESLIQEDGRRLVTLGIKPDRPATGYGYIQRGTRIEGLRAQPTFRVSRFREKPARELAEEYVRSGDYYWNSGIFVWTAATIRSELCVRRTQLIESLDRIGAAWGGSTQDKVFAAEYERIEPISIDYAVLEHADNVVVIEAGFRWDDVGSWGAIGRLQVADTDSNTVRGDHCGLGTKSSIVISDPGHLVATIGLENLIVVQCGNATLVADRTNEESVKQLVERMRQLGFEQFL